MSAKSLTTPDFSEEPKQWTSEDDFLRTMKPPLVRRQGRHSKVVSMAVSYKVSKSRTRLFS